jgi:hypothetical protein
VRFSEFSVRFLVFFLPSFLTSSSPVLTLFPALSNRLFPQAVPLWVTFALASFVSFPLRHQILLSVRFLPLHSKAALLTFSSHRLHP